jgi:hypothetical protein
MRRRSRRALHILFPLAGISIPAAAQGPLSWEQVLQRFQQRRRSARRLSFARVSPAGRAGLWEVL